MKLDHIGIATRDLVKAKSFYSDVLGLPLQWEEVAEKDGVRVAAFALGDIKIEIIEPMGPDSPVAKFLEKRGEGLHHVCYEVADLEKTLRALKNKGIPLIDEAPRPGAHGRRIAFVHPRGAGGVLVELAERQSAHFKT